MHGRGCAFLFGLCLVASFASPQAQPAILDLRVNTPAALVSFAERVEHMNRQELVSALARAGLPVPSRVDVTLLTEEDPRARAIPRWVVGRAFGSETVMILPARIGTYPYGSLESVIWHEIAHLALFIQAGGHALPRWFHEGVATSVESDWGFTTSVRLGFAIASEPDLPAVERLFASEAEPGTSRAYLLAAVLVSDLRRRYGANAPGGIAGLVSQGTPFDQAFLQYTGSTPGRVAARAWDPYRQWTNWIPTVTSRTAVWTLTLALALVAFVVTLRKRARRRRLWDEEERLFD
jgi:hypothetical protein